MAIGAGAPGADASLRIANSGPSATMSARPSAGARASRAARSARDRRARDDGPTCALAHDTRDRTRGGSRRQRARDRGDCSSGHRDIRDGDGLIPPLLQLDLVAPGRWSIELEPAFAL